MSTPPSAPAPIQAVHSTPRSIGSSGNRNHATEHTQKDYAPYLLEDLTRERKITVDQFFKWILRITEPQDTGEMERDSKFQEFMNDYNQWPTYTHETELYKPFVELANYCLDKEGAEIQLCRNDPTIVHGSDARRKPDVLSIWRAALALSRGSVDNLSKGGPGKDYAFHWMELLAFWEFKFLPSNHALSVEILTKVTPPQVSAPQKKTAKKSSSQALPGSPPPSRELRLRASETASPPTTTRPSQTTTRPSQTRASTSAKEENPRIQCASYALELLTYGGFRSHVIGARVTNNLIELLYYDRSMIVTSEPLDISQQTGKFITMLRGVADLKEKQWGYHPLLDAPRLTKLYPPGVLTDPFRGSSITLNDGRTLNMGTTIHQSHGIIGRGTYVSGAKMEMQGKKKDLVVKLSWPAKSRTSEAELVKIATQKATELGDEWVLNHLPIILHAEEKEFDEDSPQQCLSKHFGEDYEVRVLRIVVQERLYPITQLTTAAELGEAFRGIFKCYRWLFEKASIMHRDISINNLMFRRIDGKVYGVLNDFDLSSQINDPSSTSKHRTGTEPYMAIDLLAKDPPPPHLYRFDLESLYYVLAYVVCQYEEGKKINNPPFDEWDNLSTKYLLLKKKEFINEPIRVAPTSNFEALEPLTLLLHEMFTDGYNARNKAGFYAKLGSVSSAFDDKTLGGHITFDKFEQILLANLPPLT
ncbi:hypothetical protein B0H12DRAFT_1192785 [Mycena haematopus]|nr:hypothetical protein B0H12DRAFT_1192785 [Mycena haematopus]